MRRWLRKAKMGADYAQTWWRVKQNKIPYSLIQGKLPKDPSRFPIFILAGQSNMAGRAKVQVEDMRPLDRVLFLQEKKGWVQAREPMHRNRLQAKGVGPGRFFGQILSERWPDKTIGLLPCAAGGSPLQAWMSDEPYKGVRLYSRMMRQVEIARQHGYIHALLWHQGESNATAHNFPPFVDMLPAFFQRVRTDLGQPDLPILMGEIGQWLPTDHFPHANSINQILTHTSEKMEGVSLISSSGLNHMGDFVHFDRAAMQEMGRRYAFVMDRHVFNR